jgi:Ca-activated chloride channel family protein
MKPSFKLLISFALVLGLASCEKGYEDYTKNTDYNGSFSNNNGGYPPDMTGENYNEIIENPFISVAEEPVSTFSIDADGGSYANSRRMIQNGSLPVADAIRTEEFINYFPLDYQETQDGHPISLNGEITTCPWTEGHKLIRIGMKGNHIEYDYLPTSNIVFLIDVSGSMSATNKLGLLKSSFKKYVDIMRPQDRVAIVTYAGQAGVLLNSTPGTDKAVIKNKIDALGAGGSTAGAQGILTAYEIAEDNFIEGGNNRIIIGTDGDFNVGISDQDELISLIEEKRESGVFLTTIGVGTGNLNEGMLEQLANNGNGNFEYIDSEEQGEKVFVHEFGKFYTVAKDVKVQVEFNPLLVKAYRLIGYENRVLENEEFEDDTKDAGEIGVDQNITALYEIIPNFEVDPLLNPAFHIDFRYKFPDEDQSQELQLFITDEGKTFDQASESMRFTSAAASFGLLLRDSAYKGDTDYQKIISWVNSAKSYDPHQYREKFLELIKQAQSL